MNFLLRISMRLLLAGACASAIAAPPSPTEVAQYNAAIKDASHWGQLMYDHDQAAWKATDVLMADKAASKDKRLRGWITEATDAGVRVVFVGEEGGTMVALYEITPAASSKIVTDSPARPMSTEERAEFTARSTAVAALGARCTEKYNSVVLSDGSGDDRKWRVYLMPAPADPKVIPMGGYFRYEISPDGKTILDQRPFTKSCAMLPKDTLPKGMKSAGLAITHLLDPQPTEVHVFVSLTYKETVFVMTPNSIIWKVSGDTVTAQSKLDNVSQDSANY